MASTRDVAIVGAGIIGCSIAFELAKAGMQVCVLERGGSARSRPLPPQVCYRASMG